ncbi:MULTISPECIES: MarR family winged helix-turn-helix transcriptional regulator [Lysinibacillus]|uniref:MarR family transcriptional regulator n=1 Tax=Lysinibacillus antri TaxID=2498145 RepID=A0A3S0R593_9BACI|nr:MULTISPECIES: MarR family winged helix-turn-helix transcriptional regulator [Lysinibacillus]RUL50775.1 MarR family transcriptional regulator [Lysinibacillus antri]TSI11768.1 winged helix-turn-helix transcriptional regulator [Lysinibacillus sp. BW-2-10]
MDNQRYNTLSSLFEVVSSLERKWANEWNQQNHLGFSKSHILLLDLLAKEGPKRPSAIAERLKVTTGGVTVLTTKLIKCGFIEKTQNSADRRAAQIAITSEGEKMLAQSQAQVTAMVNSMFGMLTTDEIKTLHTIFEKCLVSANGQQNQND